MNAPSPEICEFEITILRGNQANQDEHQSVLSWPVVAKYKATDGLIVQKEGTLDLTKETFEGLAASENDKEYGIILGKTLFQEKENSKPSLSEVGEAFLSAFSASKFQLRFLLSIEVENNDPLRALHWERLCVPEEIKRGEWKLLALDQQIVYSRYIAGWVQKLFPAFKQTDLRALVLVASPESKDSPPFDVMAAMGTVRTALGDIPCKFLTNLEDPDRIGPPTLNELFKHLRHAKNPYTLLHFVCHGSVDKEGETQLYWATEENKVLLISGQELIKKLKMLGNDVGLPHFAFLCACESATPKAENALGGLAQNLVRELGMPAVVGMTRKVTVTTALAFGKSFYQRLSQSGYVDLALQEATAELANRTDITVPTLFSRLRGRPLFFTQREGETLNDQKIQAGLKTLEPLLRQRAPKADVLRTRFAEQQKILTENPEQHAQALQADKPELTLEDARKIVNETQDKALKELDSICLQVLDRTFREVAFSESLPEYQEIECPFPGLSTFGKKDDSGKRQYQNFFFGREDLIATLQKKLGVAEPQPLLVGKEANFLAVHGPSGSGKSSLVLAGLLPKLEKQGFLVDDLTPGGKEPPVEKLRTIIESLSKAERAVLVVDQFEELFTLCKEDDRIQFIQELLDFAQNQKVIITIRTDFLAECTKHDNLTDRINNNYLLVGPMQIGELAKAIQQQANQVELRFQEGLSNAILREVQQEQGMMPLLQYALRLLYERRRGNWLCREEYEAIGGVQKAIAKTADQVYTELNQKGNGDRVREIFEQLTHVDENESNGKPRDTRQRVKQDEIRLRGIEGNVRKALVNQLVNRLADERLVVISDGIVEVAHEALIREWEQLQKWLTESRSRLKFQQQLHPTIQRWQASQDDGELLRGARLQEASLYLEEFRDAFSPDEQAFIQASQDLPHRKAKLLTVVKTSFAVATIVSIVRIVGFLQPLELGVYNTLMRLKPGEAQDQRFLIVAVNDSDIGAQAKRNEEGTSSVLKDPSLQKLLEKLQKYEPRVVGLDLLRDFQSKTPQLATLLGKNDRLIGICTASEGTSSGKAYRYPVNIPKEQVPERVGFSNFIDQGVTLRQPLLNPPIDPELCPTENSFSFAIARRYLETEAKAKPYQPPATQPGKDAGGFKYIGNLKFGETAIKRRTGLAGGFQGDLNEPKTYQILLNYRSYNRDPRNFAEKISLEDFLRLDDQASEQKVKDKIVIIGGDSEVSADYVRTPYRDMAGPIVQAQMVSQIVSAVLDGRPLIWWWPVWLDVLWIGLWSTVGGLIVWRFQQPMQWLMGAAVSLLSLFGICCVIFAYQSGWIPLIPPILALIGTAAIIGLTTFKLRQGGSRNKRHGDKKTSLIAGSRLFNLVQKRPDSQ